MPLLVFLVWSYSFRVGMLLVVVGSGLYAGMSERGLELVVGGSGLHLASAYVPFLGYIPRDHGILGTAMLVMFIGLVCDWTRRPSSLSGSARTASDLRLVIAIIVRERPLLQRWAVRGPEQLSEGSVRGKVSLVEGRPLDR